jgi:hypothetical protein
MVHGITYNKNSLVNKMLNECSKKLAPKNIYQSWDRFLVEHAVSNRVPAREAQEHPGAAQKNRTKQQD